MNFWQGTIDLIPTSDNWIDPVKLDAKIIRREGNYAETLANAVKTLNVDPQTGFAPAIWDGWKENWTGKHGQDQIQEQDLMSRFRVLSGVVDDL